MAGKGCVYQEALIDSRFLNAIVEVWQGILGLFYFVLFEEMQIQQQQQKKYAVKLTTQ